MSNETTVRLTSAFSARIQEWSEDDRITLLVLCEAFEKRSFDALCVIADRVLQPTSIIDGRFEKLLFEVTLQRGTILFLLTQIEPGNFILSD